MTENAHVTLAGDYAGDYFVEQELPDGRLLLRPDPTPVAAATFPGRPATPEEFQALLGELRTDGEG